MGLYTGRTLIKGSPLFHNRGKGDGENRIPSPLVGRSSCLCERLLLKSQSREPKIQKQERAKEKMKYPLRNSRTTEEGGKRYRLEIPWGSQYRTLRKRTVGSTKGTRY